MFFCLLKHAREPEAAGAATSVLEGAAGTGNIAGGSSHLHWMTVLFYVGQW